MGSLASCKSIALCCFFAPRGETVGVKGVARCSPCSEEKGIAYMDYKKRLVALIAPKRVGLLILAVLLSCSSGFSGEGRIAGTVVDPSGAVIPGVAVVVHNIETGVEQRASTNAAGFYA